MSSCWRRSQAMSASRKLSCRRDGMAYPPASCRSRSGRQPGPQWRFRGPPYDQRLDRLEQPFRVGHNHRAAAFGLFQPAPRGLERRHHERLVHLANARHDVVQFADLHVELLVSPRVKHREWRRDGPAFRQRHRRDAGHAGDAACSRPGDHRRSARLARAARGPVQTPVA